MIRKKAPVIPADETTIRGFSEAFFESVLDAIEHSPTDLDGLLGNLHEADIADIIERLPRDKRQIVLGHIPFERMGDVIAELEEGVREHVLQLLNPADLKGALEELESDDAADVARSIDEMIPEHEEGEGEDYLADYQHKRLLHYDEDTAGGLMQLEVLTAPPTQTVGETLEFIRKNEAEMPVKPGTIFVVTPQRKLLGTVSISRIVRVPFEAKLQDVMRPDPLFALPEQPHTEIVSIFEKYDIHNLAVVNKRGQLLGRITIDDILDVVLEDTARQQARAVGLNEAEDLFAPVLTTARQRLPWLGINLLTAVAASAVIALFEDSIAKLTTLAVLMPIVASMGGNATTQTQTVIIRALALGQITRQNAVELLKKEFLSGGYVGTLLALLMALGCWLLYGQPMLALVIAVATVANHLFAALGGYFVPMMLKRAGYDPAISTGVLTTTITDVGGFFVFLGLATLLLL
ncbi:MAG: magnesium transporter [Pseudomonadaceae bacterium]|nr:magnesium transporter [Pseudomonadaceae bacterium]